MKLIDRGDAVKNHFCIGRKIKRGEIYWEFWNDSVRKWCSAGSVYIGRKLAESRLKKLRIVYGN